jgi:hypothetical protein
MISFDKFSFWRKTPIIEFLCDPEIKDIIPEPKPAGSYIPNWYKKLPKQTNQRSTSGEFVGTAKMCKPMLDAFSYGFTIPLVADLHIRSNYNCTKLAETQAPNSFLKLCEFHDVEQVGGENSIKKHHGNPIKFVNHWIIKTAPGWSTLIIPPVNNFDLPFTCLTGIVDTDKYFRQVNFPALWNVPDFDGVLKAGTPLVTVIPIKRKTFKQSVISRVMNEEELKLHRNTAQIMAMREHYYTEYLREKK